MTLCRLFLIWCVLGVAYIGAALVYAFPYLGLAVFGLGVWRLSRRPGRFSAMGTARWANAADVPHLLNGNGLSIGELETGSGLLAGVWSLFDRRVPAALACQRFLGACQRTPPKPLVNLSRAVHTAVFAPTGVGKGVSCVVPFLLSCRDSCVVVDFKGENYKLTADARRRMGHKVIVLDPFRLVTGEPDSFNPLSHIDRDARTALDDCRDLAEALVLRTGQEKEPHWDDSAEAWIAAMIAVVVHFAEPGDKSLQAVRILLSHPEKMQASIRLMCESDAWEGMLARLGYQLTHYRDKELSSVLTTANRHLRFLDTLPVAESTKGSSFDPAVLLTGRMTVYLVLPPDHMRAQAALLRMWVASMLRAVVKAGLQEAAKVHFVLDEAASLGHMDALDDAVDKFRGYGVRLQFYYQSLGQLKKCFPDGQDQTLLSNVTQVFFGTNDYATAEYVSNRLGEQTILLDSGGSSAGTTRQTAPAGSDSHSASHTNSRNWQFHARRLLKPEEVLGLPERLAVTFLPNTPPLLTRLVRYYEPAFLASRRLGAWKVVFDTTCLVLAVAFIAVVFTAGVFRVSY